MGHQVTVEGSVTPSDWLARGARRTVAVTDEIRKLVRIGAVVVVAGDLDDPDAPAYGGQDTPDEPTPEPEPEPVEDYAPPTQPFNPLTDEQLANDPEPEPEADEADEPPARNGSREDWAAWVAAKVPGAETDGVGRDELRQLWDDFDGQR